MVEFLMCVEKISGPFAFEAFGWVVWKSIGMKLSLELICVVFHIGVQAKIIFDSCMFNAGNLEVIMKSNICDVPRGLAIMRNR
jgi:hypothetical protein